MRGFHKLRPGTISPTNWENGPGTGTFLQMKLPWRNYSPMSILVETTWLAMIELTCSLLISKRSAPDTPPILLKLVCQELDGNQCPQPGCLSPFHRQVSQSMPISILSGSTACKWQYSTGTRIRGAP